MNFQLNRESNLVNLLQKVGYYLLVMQFTRIVFLIYNFSFFSSFHFFEIIGGTWFDLVTFCLLGSPFIVFHQIPFKFRYHKIYNLFLNSYYYLLTSLSVLLNLIDAEYYSFSGKRSTSDLFKILSLGNDINQEIGAFFRDYWSILLLLFTFLGILIFLHKKTIVAPKFKNYKIAFLHFFLILPFTVLIGRGGIGLRPISVLDASYFTSPEKIGLVLNTPFTILKSYGKGTLTDPDYYTQEEVALLFNPLKESQPQHLFSQQQNVVIVLLESFGAEFVGAAGSENSFTPFLDSLSEQSLNFTYGIANGKRSIEALPAIYASIPTWMDEAYITSPYNSNNVESIAQILNKNNYTTAFFHGATNGSMKFDSFTQQMGVQHYFGRNEYPNDADFDGTWGIKDEEFLQWSIDKMTEFQTPFFSTIFTLSSHHPYFIPEKWKGKLKTGAHPLAETINYTDECLRLFMQKAKKQSWYSNTLFIFLADHTPMPVDKRYATYAESYHIPIFIFDPKGRIEPQNSSQYFQQIDLYPTLLDLLDIKTSYYSFGNSYFSKVNEGMSYAGSNYYYFKDNYLLTFQNNQARTLVNLNSPSNPEGYFEDSASFYQEKVQQMTQRTKALIQVYNCDLINNQTSPKKYDSNHKYK